MLPPTQPRSKGFSGWLGFVACWAWLLPTAVPGASSPPGPSWSSVTISEVQVDGQWQKLNGPAGTSLQELKLPAGSHALGFRFATTPETDENCLRMRYKLEGLDKDWRELQPQTGMRVTVRFQNAANDFLDENNFYALGDSEGWRGALERSTFSTRRETVVVPEGAVNVVLLLVSGGSAVTLGASAIDDLRLSVASKARPGHEELWFKDDFETGTDLDKVTGTPREWQRGGLRRDILQVVRCQNSPANHALAAVDTHVRSFGEWFRTLRLDNRVAPGDTLIVEWKEAYSVGFGKAGTASYDVVPPGHYIFRLAGLTPLEGTAVASTALPMELPPPFWHQLWFVLSCVGAVALVVAIAVRHLTRRRMQLQMERLRWQQSLERERMRIARDIHDDLGAGLTRIAMLSAMVQERLRAPTPPPAELEEVIQTVQELVGTLDEIVWAVNPKHDKLDSLIAYCGQYAQGFFKPLGIPCRLDLAFDVPDWALTSQMRHNLFLAFKEALNNAARHAGARTVRVSASLADDSFVLALHDDGQGFAPDAASPDGNGLANMQHRLSEVGGQCRIESRPGQGTTVTFLLKKQP